MMKLGYLCADNVDLIICKKSELSYAWHNHTSVITLGFIFDGVIEVVTNRSIDIYHKNDVFFIMPYIPHCINAKSRYTLVSICINNKFVNNTKLENIKTYIGKFLHNAINDYYIERMIIKALSSVISVSEMLPVPKETYASKLRMILEMYPETKFSMDDLAKKLSINKYSLIRSFKEEFGLTPHQFLIQNRIRKAQKLLKESATITEMAMATGFCDQSHFIKYFKRILGITPTAYKSACNIVPPVAVRA